MKNTLEAESLIDIGTNLTNKRFERDRYPMLARAKASGVSRILATGVSVRGSRDAARLAAELAAHARSEQGQAEPALPQVFSTAGIHPHHASEYAVGTDAALRALYAAPLVVAAGECGLDYNRNFSSPAAQRGAFAAQLKLAADAHLPVFLHEREAFRDFVAILREHRQALAGGVVHCFTSDQAALEAYLELDLHIGLTGWIADERRGQHLIPLARLIPEGRLLIETDAPYITPRNLPREQLPKDRRNEAAFLPYVALAIAEARGESVEALGRHTTRAANECFRLDQALTRRA